MQLLNSSLLLSNYFIRIFGLHWQIVLKLMLMSPDILLHIPRFPSPSSTNLLYAHFFQFFFVLYLPHCSNPKSGVIWSSRAEYNTQILSLPFYCSSCTGNLISSPWIIFHNQGTLTGHTTLSQENHWSNFTGCISGIMLLIFISTLLSSCCFLIIIPHPVPALTSAKVIEFHPQSAPEPRHWAWATLLSLLMAVGELFSLIDMCMFPGCN